MEYTSNNSGTATQATTPSDVSRMVVASRVGRQESLGPSTPTLKRAQNLLTAAGTPSSLGIHEVLVQAEANQKRERMYPATANVNGDLSTNGFSQEPKKTKRVAQGGTYESHTAGLKPPSPTTIEERGRQWAFGASLRRKISEAGKSSGRAIKRSISNAGAGARSAVSAGGGNRHTRSFSESQKREANTGASSLSSSRSSTFSTTGNESPSNSQSQSDICEGASRTMDGSDTASPKNIEEGSGVKDVKVPLILQEGTPMTKVSAKKQKTVIFRIDPDEGYILWESKKSGIIPIECIKEIRTRADARYYREQFQISSSYENRWITLVYLAVGKYKTLHLVAITPDTCSLWERTLRELYAARQELMSGLGNTEARQNVWERRYWRGADSGNDKRLLFEEVVTLCRRLNLGFTREELMRRFAQADTRLRGYLDFDDFRKFVKLLKDRPEIRRLYLRLTEDGKRTFDFEIFKKFMRNYQKFTLDDKEIEDIFKRYTRESRETEFPLTPPSSLPSLPTATDITTPPTPPSTEQPTTTPATCGEAGAESQPNSDASPNNVVNDGVTKQENPIPSETKDNSKLQVEKPLSELTMSLDAFSSFLMSTDNAVFAEQGKGVYQDMTRPLPEYYISSSHNTYLVGHQLVGNSTIEGYIRALLHSCRSVEIDIYDGENEPVIYHGKTLTSKVPLRDICVAIAKYAFVTSPYPVIISAEVHCGLSQQDMIAFIMREVFGDALVTAPSTSKMCFNVEDPLRSLNIENLPSPEDLKGRVLLKAKNIYLTEQGKKEKGTSAETESSASSSTETSASDSEFVRDVRTELKHELDKARNVNAVKEIREEIQKPLQEMKQEFSKAKNLMNRVRRKKSPSPPRRSKSDTTAQTGLPSSPPEKVVALQTSATMPMVEKKVRMSHALLGLLVYTVGVKCRGFNKKEVYAPEHLFSLSERTASKYIKQSLMDLVKHNKTHLVRIYPNGLRLNSSNYEPHRYWAAGAQLVALNWQTFDLGYMINQTMFQRNGRAGYVLKPPALRNPSKEILGKFTKYNLDVTIVSAQQLPRRKDSEGREIVDKSVVDPYVEVSVYVPDWTRSPYVTAATSSFPPASTSDSAPATPPQVPSSPSKSSTSLPTVSTSARTTVVKNNGFNPVWEESVRLSFSVPGGAQGGLMDLIFVRFAVHDEDDDENDPLAIYCASLGSLMQGYRHLPLHDSQLSQYLFSTLFVHIDLREA